MSITVTVNERETFNAALKQVRSDTSETNWLLATHHNQDPNTLQLVGSGCDGVQGMMALVDSSNVYYGLLRTTEVVDMSKTVKFVYVYFSGQDVPFMKRGRFGVVKGDATKLFQPYHVDFDIASKNEISPELIKAKVSEASGTAIKVRDKGFIEGKQERGFTQRSSQPDSNIIKSAPKTAAASNVPTASRSDIKFADDIKEAIAQVRNDKEKVSFVLASYVNNSEVKLLAKGSDSAWTLEFKDDRIIYGLFRFPFTIDKSTTIKFCFVTFVGKEANVMLKARISTHKGAADKIFSPYHTSMTAGDAKEVTEHAMLDLIKRSAK